jgi:hypothetical protein
LLLSKRSVSTSYTEGAGGNSCCVFLKYLRKTLLSVALRTLHLTVGRSHTSKVRVTSTHVTSIIIHGTVKSTVWSVESKAYITLLIIGGIANYEPHRNLNGPNLKT